MRCTSITKEAATASVKSTIRCTRRIRDPLNYLIMQSTDHDQVSTSIRTTEAAMVTWYVPLHNIQHTLHRRYEAEQFGELLLPKGVAPPKAKPLTPTQDEVVNAAAKAGPSVIPKLLMSAPMKPASFGHQSEDSAAASASASSNSKATASSGASSATEDPYLADNSLNNVTMETGETVVPLGLVTMIVGNNIPAKQSRLEKWLDPAPHPTLSLRAMVMDRIHWQRTSWCVGSVCHSLCWGRLPQRIFSINLDFKNHVVISGGDNHPRGPVFNANSQRYTSPFQVEVPGLGFKMVVEDTGRTLFDPTTRVVDGFLENESALHRLALSREVNMLGLGGSVYRQTLWSTPSLPNIGRIVHCEFGQLFERYFGCSPVGEPVATWLVDEVAKTLIYQMEGEVEDENDPNSATTYGDRSLTERVQKKAMNRYNNFRDDIRNKTYSEMRGDEVPR